MPSILLDGKQVATKIKSTLKQTVAKWGDEHRCPPGLAVILMGSDPASLIYVDYKHKACTEVGIASFAHYLPLETTEQALLQLIDTLNEADNVDGILLQLPLPPHLNRAKILAHINPAKDVDGFHPINIGRLAQGDPFLRPCTPYGIMQLIHYYDFSLIGKHVVIIGASNIVGRPMALEVLLAKATVTICHRETRNLATHVRNADVVIIAAGSIDVIDVSWLNPQQMLIDVGIHRLANGKIRGDIDFNQAKDRVGWITPVPGGVGPMTISTLLQNTILAADQLRG